MWAYFFTALGVVFAAIGAVCKSSRRTVDPGCRAIKSRLGKPVTTKEQRDGMTERVLKIYQPGQIIWIIPGVHALRQVRSYEANTAGSDQPIKLADSRTYIVRAVLTYDVSPTVGLPMALIKLTPEKYDEQVDHFFAGVVLRVVESQGMPSGQQMTTDSLLAEARCDPHLVAYGVIPTRVVLLERAGTDVTQFFEQASEGFAQAAIQALGMSKQAADVAPAAADTGDDSGGKVIELHTEHSSTG